MRSVEVSICALNDDIIADLDEEAFPRGSKQRGMYSQFSQLDQNAVMH